MSLPVGTRYNDHLTRYYVRPNWFIDREDSVLLRQNGYKYEVFGAGAGIMTRAGYRIAAFRGGADTLKAALKLLPSD